MASPSESDSIGPRPSPLGIAVQVVGFLVGVGLLIWCLTLGWTREDGTPIWRDFVEAEWWMIAGLIGSTLVSLTVNAWTFHRAFLPVRNVGFWHMQKLNVTANALNYLPLRPGLIARVAYHVRIDRIGLVQVAATFAAIALVLLVTASAAGFASLVRRDFDVLWLGLLLAGLFCGGGFVMLISRMGLVERYGRGFDRVLREHRMMWTLVALRLVDLAAYAVRMACAMAIVGEFDSPSFGSPSYVIMLAILAMLFGLFPVRIGFREAGLAFAAGWFGQSELGEGVFNQMALIESAGEAVVYLPLGVCYLPWLRRRWVNARKDTSPRSIPDHAKNT